MLAVLLVALSASYVANQSNLGEQLEAAESQAKAARALATSTGQADQALIANLQSAAAALEGAQRQASQDLAGKDGQLANLAKQKADVEGEKAALETQVTLLTARDVAKDARIEAAQTAITEAESALNERRQSVQELTLRVATLDNENTLLKDRVERLGEQAFATTQLIEQLEDRLRNAGSPSALADAGDAPEADGGILPIERAIRGQVVDVDDVASGLRFLEINVGSQDNVRRGDRFFVYRGRQYLGTLEINTVDVAVAVGRVEGQRSGEIQAGDLIQSGI